MEYRKEDLMEAKKQILGVGENMGTEESKKRLFGCFCGLLPNTGQVNNPR